MSKSQKDYREGRSLTIKEKLENTLCWEADRDVQKKEKTQRNDQTSSEKQMPGRKRNGREYPLFV